MDELLGNRGPVYAYTRSRTPCSMFSPGRTISESIRMEAPSGSSGVLPLDNFSSVSFTAASAIQNGQTVDISNARAQPITMLNANNQPLAVSSAIDSNGSSFSIARTTAPASTGTAGGPGRRPGGGPVPVGQGA